MSGSLPVLEARNVRVFYNHGFLSPRRNYITPPVSCSILANEIVGLSGPSGCGKTSLGKALLGLSPAWEGDIFWRGNNIRRMSLRRLRPFYGWIGQEPTMAFNPQRKILDALLETLKVNGRSDGGRQRIFKMCDQLNLERELMFRHPFEMSPGQIQRCSLIRVFMLEPRFVLLDEPTSSLDPVNQTQLYEYIFSWRRVHGLAILLISHSNDFLSRICQKIISLEEDE